MDSESLDKIDKLWESAERLGFIGHFLSVWAFLFHPRSFWGKCKSSERGHLSSEVYAAGRPLLREDDERYFGVKIGK